MNVCVCVCVRVCVAAARETDLVEAVVHVGELCRYVVYIHTHSHKHTHTHKHTHAHTHTHNIASDKRPGRGGCRCWRAAGMWWAWRIL
jgi:hypothetical protein